MTDNRLSVDAWINAGLKAMAVSGFTVLKADILAKTLGVSRGSFYWHFADVEAYHAAVLVRWSEVAYANIVAEVEVEAGPSDRLTALMKRAFAANPDLERAMRAWASAEAKVRSVVDAVDAGRLRYLKELLIQSGLAKDVAQARAQVIYWTYLGRVVAPGKLKAAAIEQVIDELGRFAAGKV